MKEDRSDVFVAPSASDETCCCVLDSLERSEERFVNAVQERITVVYVRGDECVHSTFCEVAI